MIIYITDDVCIHICTCDQCTRHKKLQERTEMQPILVSYPLELIHLDFLTSGGRRDNNRVLTFWLSHIISPNMHRHMGHQNKQHQWSLRPYGKISLYIMDGLKRFSQIEESLLKIVSLGNVCELAQVKTLHTSPY